MYKVNNTLTSAYGDMDLSKKQGPVREYSYFVTKCRNLICYSHSQRSYPEIQI